MILSDRVILFLFKSVGINIGIMINILLNK